MRGKRAAGNLVYMTSPTVIVLLFLGCYHALTSAQGKSTSTTNRNCWDGVPLSAQIGGARAPLASFFIFLVISHIIFYHYFYCFICSIILLWWLIDKHKMLHFLYRSFSPSRYWRSEKWGTTANFTFIHERKISLIFCREKTYCASKQPCYCCLVPDKCFFTMEECRANCL
jgi:hypothetical protein